MNLFIVAFDGLDADYVEHYECSLLQQAVHGRTSLEGYVDGGGRLDYITDELFATFITGTVPDVHGIKLPIDLKFSLRDTKDTIFDHYNGQQFDVPSWNRNPQHHLFQNRVGWFFGNDRHRKAINMEHKEYWDRVRREQKSLIPDVYYYLFFTKMPEILPRIENRDKLSMAYFWFSDIIGHVSSKGRIHKGVYWNAEIALREIKKHLPEDTVVMVMSDHGMKQREHDPKAAFWSLSEPLLDSSFKPEIEEWRWILEELLNE